MNEILQQLFKAARDQYHPLPDLALERRVLERWHEHVVQSQNESISEANLVEQFNSVQLVRFCEEKPKISRQKAAASWRSGNGIPYTNKINVTNLKIGQ